MAENNICISHALLKELKSTSHQLLITIDDFDMVSHRLRMLYKAFSKTCEKLDQREG